MMILTLDAQNNQIVIEDSEVGPVPWKHDINDLHPTDRITVDLAESGRLAKMNLSDIDFEGFVLTLIDKNGQKWSTEIIGMVAIGNA